MATTGKVPIRGFAASAIKWVVTRGFSIGARVLAPFGPSQRVIRVPRAR